MSHEEASAEHEAVAELKHESAHVASPSGKRSSVFDESPAAYSQRLLDDQWSRQQQKVCIVHVVAGV